MKAHVCMLILQGLGRSLNWDGGPTVRLQGMQQRTAGGHAACEWNDL